MPPKTTILNAMQFSYLRDKDPLNTTGAPRETITFQYATTSQPADLPSGTVFTGWQAFTNPEKAAFEAALDLIETFLNVSFTEVAGDADPDMNVGKVSLPGPTAGIGGNGISFSGSTILAYDSFAVFDNTLDLTDQINLILHEVGHALGLKHPFEGAPVLTGDFNSNKYSVMSYTENPDNGLVSDTMMLYDVFALQDLWGAAGYNGGATSYTGSRTATVDTIWDTGGTDIFDAAAKTGPVTLDLRQAAFSSFDSTNDVVIAYGTRIENARGGSAGDTITGNNLKNTLEGGGGGDIIKGGGKRDIIKGGAGKDTLLGQAGNDKLVGGGGGDILRGGAGRDVLDGQRGNEMLTGGGGADRFVFRQNGDRDTVSDFADGVDSLRFFGLGDAATVLAAATETGGNVVFDFGGGNVLTVLNATIAALSDDIIA